jgi:ankyrin repeat protein
MLHDAARNGDLAQLQELIAAGDIDLEETDKLSRTALHLACWSGHNDVVFHLVSEAGAKCNVNAGDKMTPLHFAAAKGFSEICRTLIVNGGATVDPVDSKKKRTPLMSAVAGGHAECVSVLLKSGASLEKRNKGQQTCIDMAEAAGNDDFVDMLQREAAKREKAKTKAAEAKAASGADGATKRPAEEDVGIAEDTAIGPATGPETKKKKSAKKEITLSHLEADE